MKNILQNAVIRTLWIALLSIIPLGMFISCEDLGNGDNSSQSYDYICANGTAVTDEKSDSENTNKCASCDSYYRLNDSECVATVYTCSNGTANSSSPMADSHTTTDADIQRCDSCTQTDYIVNDNHECVQGIGFNAQIVADGNITPTGGNFTITSTHNGMLYWIAYANDATAPADAATLIADADNTSVGVARIGATPMPVTANMQASFSVSGLAAGTNYDLYAALSLDVNGTVEQRLSIKFDMITALYPYVCANGTPVEGGTTNQNTNKCNACDTGYRTDGDNCALNRYSCTNGIAVTSTDTDKPDTDNDVEKCAMCNLGNWLDGATANCIAHGTLDVNGAYGVAVNGVTVVCPSVADSGTFTIDGTTYTKRAKNAITTTNAAATCTTGITDMTGLFTVGYDANSDGDYNDEFELTPVAGASTFNQDISHWDTASVTTMWGLFRGAAQFDQDIGSWDVSNVISMVAMFVQATDFNQDISDWVVRSVTDMGGMFVNATSFNQDIGRWNVSNVTTMASMFASATAFDQDISSWNVSKVQNMRQMFTSSTAFNQDISGWDVRAVTDMESMFNFAFAFNQNISTWCVKDINPEPSMFKDDANTAWRNNSAYQPKWGDSTVTSCSDDE